jgi:hypothetical protein
MIACEFSIPDRTGKTRLLSREERAATEEKNHCCGARADIAIEEANGGLGSRAVLRTDYQRYDMYPLVPSQDCFRG